MDTLCILSVAQATLKLLLSHHKLSNYDTNNYVCLVLPQGFVMFPLSEPNEQQVLKHTIVTIVTVV